MVERKRERETDGFIKSNHWHTINSKSESTKLAETQNTHHKYDRAGRKVEREKD